MWLAPRIATNGNDHHPGLDPASGSLVRTAADHLQMLACVLVCVLVCLLVAGSGS